MRDWRCWLAAAFLMMYAASAWAAPPVLRVAPGMEPLSLARQMNTFILPADNALTPDEMWLADGAVGAPASSTWQLHADERWIGRARLATDGAVGHYVVQVPMPQVDRVQIWWRTNGGPWRSAQAGDRLALSRWPFASPFPAFQVQVGEQPVDLVVAVENAAWLRVPVTLLTDAQFRDNLVRRANLSGLVMGLGTMVTLVCLLGAIFYGKRARWVLAGVCAWTLFSIAAGNGYLGVWLTGEWTAFNDWSRSFSGIVLAGLMLLMCVEALDPLHVRPAESALALAAPFVALAFAVMQVAWLPTAARVGGVAVSAAVAVAGAGVLCGLNYLRGGRHDAWVAGAIVSMAAAPFVAFAAPDEIANLDLRSAGLAASLYVALMLVRHALQLRDRYGRDVLGRAAIAANRDPLTALWSYDGFQQCHAEAALREAAGQGTSSVMLLALPGLDDAAKQHGSMATERALVRFAATLQELLGQQWAVARVSRTRFAAISMRPLPTHELVDIATQVLTQCSRMTQPLPLVTGFDLRIACSRRRIADMRLSELLRVMKHAALSLSHGKRIVYLQPMSGAMAGESTLAELLTRP